MQEIKCPKCESIYCYNDGEKNICPDCFHEWVDKIEENEEKEYRDANGNILVNGDNVIVIKDLKVKGSSLVVKKGTKVKNIRLKDDDHDIDCKIPQMGNIQLKTMYVKKI